MPALPVVDLPGHSHDDGVAHGRAAGEAIAENLRIYFDRFQREARLDVETWPELLRNERLLAAIRRQMDTLRESFVEMFKQAQAEAHLGGPERLPPVDLYNLVSAVYQGLRLNVLLEPEAVDPQGVFQVLLQLLRRPEGAPAPASAATVEEGG